MTKDIPLYFMLALEQSAINMGFDKKDAKLIVSQLFKGTIELYKQSDITPSQWIEKISTPNGTTEAALKSFEENNLHQKIIDGLNQNKNEER